MWSITTISKEIFGKFSFEKFRDLIIEFKDLKVYSDLFFSNNLFFYFVCILTDIHDLKITVSEFTFLEILTSPKGRLIDFFP